MMGNEEETSIEKIVKEKCRYYLICNSYKEENITCQRPREAMRYCGLYRNITKLFSTGE